MPLTVRTLEKHKRFERIVLMKELHDGAGSVADAVDVPGALVSRKLWYKFPEKL